MRSRIVMFAAALACVGGCASGQRDAAPAAQKPAASTRTDESSAVAEDAEAFSASREGGQRAPSRRPPEARAGRAVDQPRVNRR